MPGHYKKKKEEDEEPPTDKMAKVRAAKKSKPKAKAKAEAPSGDMSDAEYYKEHKKHHSAKHIKAMKELQKMGVEREAAHKFTAKHLGK